MSRNPWRAASDASLAAAVEAGSAAHRERVAHNRRVAEAHRQVAQAIRDGRLIRPDCCTECGYRGRVEGHHDDYALPLEVRWLCRRCHRVADRERRVRDGFAPVPDISAAITERIRRQRTT